MKFWLLILVMFAMFAVACEDKPSVELEESAVKEDISKAKEVTEKSQPAEEPKEKAKEKAKAKAKEDTPKAKKTKTK